MHRIEARHGKDGSIVVRADDTYFYAPLKDKSGKYIFTCSMSDFFIEEADSWRAEAWKVIKNTPWHTWQILTKRPERIAQCLPEDWGNGYPNVWLGVSIENQKTIPRIEELLKVPARIYFISAEPLLEEINFIQEGKNLLDKFDWVIIGGESGNDYGEYRYRECAVEWMEKVVKDARRTEHTKVFVKQMGTYLAKRGIGSVTHNGQALSKHGDDYMFFPESLQIREIPDPIKTTLF
jgi:protein gp37